jgi:hypothetical protein
VEKPDRREKEGGDRLKRGEWTAVERQDNRQSKQSMRGENI